MKKIKYSDLVRKIQDGKIKESEIESYFSPSLDMERGKRPSVVIDERHVEIAGVEKAARLSAAALVEAAGLALRSKAVVARSAVAAAPAIVAEGDSWFNLPSVIYPPTIADFLSQRFAITNIAMWGDELIADIVRSGQYARTIDPARTKFVLFSAGGNDFLARLADFLRQRQSGDNDPANAPRYVRDGFYELIDDIYRAYVDIAATIRAMVPTARIIVHGYDYPKPKVDGPFLGNDLQFRGFHPRQNKAITDALLRFMMNQYNDRMTKLRDNQDNVDYVDLRGKLPRNAFFDEIHPNTRGAELLAREFDPWLGATIATS